MLDIFGRLNSYAVVLNEQEKLNAEYFGEFKVLADTIGRRYYEYWIGNKILTNKMVLRMAEVSLVADLLIAMKEGIKSKKRIRPYYRQYEKDYDADTDQLTDRFDAIIAKITEIFPEGLSSTEFSRPFLFYSLFTAVAHCLYGLPNFAAPQVPLNNEASVQVARNGLDRVGELFAATEADMAELSTPERTFLQNSRRATTDESAREGRAEFLLSLMA